MIKLRKIYPVKRFNNSLYRLQKKSEIIFDVQIRKTHVNLRSRNSRYIVFFNLYENLQLHLFSSKSTHPPSLGLNIENENKT